MYATLVSESDAVQGAEQTQGTIKVADMLMDGS